MFKKSLLASAITLAALQVNAAGFQLNEHSAAGLGRANAGEAAIADNAAVIARNPAAMAMFKDISITAGVSYIDPEVDVKGTVTHQQLAQLGVVAELDSSESNIAPNAFVPHFYLVAPIDDKLAFGLALNSNYGLKTSYSDSFNAADVADEAEIKTIYINPNVSYRINDKLSLGLGVSAVYGEGTFGTSFPAYAIQAAPAVNAFLAQNPAVAQQLGLPGLPTSHANILHVSGDDWGFGWNAGLMWEQNENFRVALSYRSGVDLELSGDAKSDFIAAYNTSGSLDVEMPAVAELAAYYQFHNDWAVSSSINWTEWSTFESLIVDMDGIGEVLLREEDWDDNWRYAVGLTHFLSDDITLRAGFAYDKTPVTDREHRSLSIPDSDRFWYSLGATYQVNKNLSVDLGITLINGEEAELEETSALGTQFKGSSEGDAQLYSLSANYSF